MMMRTLLTLLFVGTVVLLPSPAKAQCTSNAQCPTQFGFICVSGVCVAPGQPCGAGSGCPAPLTCQAGTCQPPAAGGGGSSGIDTQYINQYRNSIIWIINEVLVPLLFAIAFFVFIYGVYHYFILGAANPEKRKDGSRFILWGIIGFVVILSVWGLVFVVRETLGLDSSFAKPPIPQL